MKKLLTLVLSLFVITQTFAQIEVTGKVLDQKSGVGLPGVSVVEKGTQNGTITDFDGNYTIKVEKESILVFSFIGFKTKRVHVKGRTILNVEMEDEMVALDDVVVVGYGTMKKSDLTGSVSSVDLETVREQNAKTVDQLLQGKTAGLYVSGAGAGPGSVLNVRIRGTNSLSNSNEPLYVIDGVIVEYGGSELDMGDEGYNPPSNPLSSLNPQDIANIEVLKDASATAIYGSKGANGVIIITTKSGGKGKPRISVSSTVSTATMVNRYEMLSGLEYIRYRNEAEMNSGNSSPYFDLMQIYSTLQEGEQLEDKIVAHNWMDEYSRTAISYENRVSVAGGSKKSKYFLAAGQSHNESVIKNSGMDNYNLRLNFSHEITEKLQFSTNLTLSKTNLQAASGNGRAGGVKRSGIRSLIAYSPILTHENKLDYFADGEEDPDEKLNTPKHWIEDFKDNASELNAIGAITLDYEINDLLKLKLRGGTNYRDKERQKYWPRTLTMGYPAGKASLTELTVANSNFDLLMFFNKKLGNHKINGTIGGTYNLKNIENYGVLATGFTDDNDGFDMLSTATDAYPSVYTKSREQVLSGLGRFNYNYMNRYLATVSFRADGSSKFHPDRRWGYFPAVALAWRASEEAFIKKFDFIYNLKVRAGWGLTGNQSLPPYNTRANYSAELYPFHDQLQTAYYSANIANEELTWESTEQLNFGIDAGFFDNRINLVVDMYHKRTTDCLMSFALPTSSGYSNIWRNFGEIENKGLEIAAEFVVVDKPLKWTIGGNIAFNRNKITKLGLPVSDYGYVQYWGENIHNDGALQQAGNTFIEGQSIGQFWGYKTDGVYQNENEIAEGIEPGKNPGDIRFVDVNGDNQINTLDQTIIGDPNPDFTYAIMSKMSYKGFTLSVLVNGVQGKEILNANLYTETDLSGTSQNVRRDAWYGRWTGEGTSNYYPRAVAQTYMDDIVTDRLIEDASFIRLQNVSLAYSYQFKNKTFPIKGISAFVAASNLLLITDYSGFDPEVDSFSWDNSRIGIDNNSFPNARTFTFGLGLNF